MCKYPEVPSTVRLPAGTTSSTARSRTSQNQHGTRTNQNLWSKCIREQENEENMNLLIHKHLMRARGRACPVDAEVCNSRATLQGASEDKVSEKQLRLPGTNIKHLSRTSGRNAGVTNVFHRTTFNSGPNRTLQVVQRLGIPSSGSSKSVQIRKVEAGRSAEREGRRSFLLIIRTPFLLTVDPMDPPGSPPQLQEPPRIHT